MIRVRPAAAPTDGWISYPTATRFVMHGDGDLTLHTASNDYVAGWARGQWAAAEQASESEREPA